MKKVFYFFKLLLNLSRIARNPMNTAAALAVGPCLMKLDLLNGQMAQVTKDPAARGYIESRKFLNAYSLQELNGLPASTLGHAYSNHMLENNLKPDFYEVVPISNDASYVMMRMRETHDLWHVLTGFGTSVPEELGLQAFMYAQIRTPLAPMLICGRTLVAVFKNPKEVPEIFDRVAHGWNLGIKAKPIFSLNWEENWQTPLKDIKAEYQVL